MTVMIYVAHPIDSVRPGRYKGELRDLRANLELSGKPTVMFTPSRAWTLQGTEGGVIDARLQQGNRQLLGMADIVIVLLKDSDGSVGVGREIQEALHLNKWVIVQWDGNHWSLGDLLVGHQKVVVTTSNLDARWWQDFFRCLFDQPSTVGVQGTPKADDVSMRPSLRLGGEGGDPQWEIRWTGGGCKPSRTHAGDAGFDLTYSGNVPLVIRAGEIKQVPSQIHMNWPNNPPVWGLLMGRSSSNKKNLIVYPSVIDTGYTGDLFAVVHNLNQSKDGTHVIKPGDRIAQIIPLPNIAANLPLRRVESISDFQTTDKRGKSGFGSSGS